MAPIAPVPDRSPSESPDRRSPSILARLLAPLAAAAACVATTLAGLPPWLDYRVGKLLADVRPPTPEPVSVAERRAAVRGRLDQAANRVECIVGSRAFTWLDPVFTRLHTLAVTWVERAGWAHATTLADLGEGTAQWAEGTIRYHPGGYDRGPAEETRPICEDLAVLNRGGLVTFGSQPGEWCHRDSGADLLDDAVCETQRAVVYGAADHELAPRLVAAALVAGLNAWWEPLTPGQPGRPCHVHRPDPSGRRVPVTVYTDDQVPDDVTATGVDDSPTAHRWIAETWAGGVDQGDVIDMLPGVGDTAVEAVLAARWVTVVDPQWGRERLLWDTLRAVVESLQEVTP